MGATRQWMRWVDLGVGHSLGGSISSWRDIANGQGGSIGGWVRGAILLVLGCDSPVLGCAIGALASAWMCD